MVTPGSKSGSEEFALRKVSHQKNFFSLVVRVERNKSFGFNPKKYFAETFSTCGFIIFSISCVVHESLIKTYIKNKLIFSSENFLFFEESAFQILLSRNFFIKVENILF